VVYPLIEILLCGHGTIASAHILWEEGLIACEEVIFEILSGNLIVKRLEGNLIELNFAAFSCHRTILPAQLENIFSNALAVKL